MTDQEQQRADHLALVAATVFTALWSTAEPGRFTTDQIVGDCTDLAELLQRAAEERVKHE